MTLDAALYDPTPRERNFFLSPTNKRIRLQPKSTMLPGTYAFPFQVKVPVYELNENGPKCGPATFRSSQNSAVRIVSKLKACLYKAQELGQPAREIEVRICCAPISNKPLNIHRTPYDMPLLT
eukprot:1184705-Prorocentrum_minimum.AAC.4